MASPKLITFDCYGTLVRWNEGLERALGGILRHKGTPIDTSDFVKSFHSIRHEETTRPYRTYKTILGATLERTLLGFGIRHEVDDTEALLAAVRSMEPFPEVPDVLLKLRRHHKIAIISNSDRDLIAGSVSNLGVPVDWVFVAEDAHAYKPSLDFFNYALRKVGCGASDVVHVGANMSLDMEPAFKLGLDRVWVNRRGAESDPRWLPYAEIKDLAGLPELIDGSDNTPKQRT